MSKKIAQTVSGPKIAWLLAIVAAFAVLATLGTQWQSSDAASNSDQVQEISFSDVATESFQGAQDTLIGSLSLSNILSPQGEGRNGATATFAQAVWNSAIGYSLDDSASGIPSNITRENGLHGHYNGQTVQTLSADAEELRQELESKFDFASDNATTPFGPDSLEYGADIAGVLNPSGNPLNYSSFGNPDANPWNTNSLNTAKPAGWDLFHERTGSGEVIASSADSAGPADGLVPDAGAYAQESTGDSQDTIPAASSEVDAKSAAGGGASANWLFAVLGLGAIALGVGGVTVARRSR